MYRCESAFTHALILYFPGYSHMVKISVMLFLPIKMSSGFHISAVLVEGDDCSMKPKRFLEFCLTIVTIKSILDTEIWLHKSYPYCHKPTLIS